MKMRKFRATKITEKGTRIELWAAAKGPDIAIVVAALTRRGFDIEVAPDLPDPPEFQDFIIAPAGWENLSYRDGRLKEIAA